MTNDEYQQTPDCIATLAKIKSYNQEKCIRASDVAVIDQMLRRSEELTEAFSELEQKLGVTPFALDNFFEALLSASTAWHPDKVRKSRAAERELTDLNDTIASLAKQLSELVQRRSHLSNDSAFSSSHQYHIVQLIQNAGQNNVLFRSLVHDPIDALPREFNLKYWPSISEVLDALAEDATNAEIRASDKITEAASTGTRNSKADFFKAYFALIAQAKEGMDARIHHSFKLSDEALASLANCALDLDSKRLVDGNYVKNIRHREKNRRVA